MDGGQGRRGRLGDGPYVLFRFFERGRGACPVPLTVPRAHDADVTGFDVFQLQARAKSGAVEAAGDDACRAVVESVRADLAARPPL